MLSSSNWRCPGWGWPRLPTFLCLLFPTFLSHCVFYQLFSICIFRCYSPISHHSFKISLNIWYSYWTLVYIICPVNTILCGLCWLYYLKNQQVWLLRLFLFHVPVLDCLTCSSLFVGGSCRYDFASCGTIILSSYIHTVYTYHV